MIPTAGKVIDLDGRSIDLIVNCVSLIREQYPSPNIEIIVVHNGDLGDERISKLGRWDCRLILYSDPIFNVARKLNLGAQEARGDYLILLNDDIEPVTPDWIERMIFHLRKPHVGVVGAKLLYTSLDVQHAGVVTNHGNPDHVARLSSPGDVGYFFSNRVARNFGAVTGACMATPTGLYQTLGGYTEGLAVSFNDVDYCLKARERGLTVVCANDVSLIHFESKSRIPSLDMREYNYLRERWAWQLTSDPFYNEDRLTIAPPTFQVRFSLDGTR